LGAIQSGNVIRIKVAFDELKDGISELPDAVADGFKNISFTDAENKVTSFLDRIKQQIFGVKTEAAKVIPSGTTTDTTNKEDKPNGIVKSPQAYSTSLLNTELIKQVESIYQVKSAQELLNETFATTQERQQNLIETNNARLEQDEKINESIIRGQKLLEGITSITSAVTDSIFTALEKGQNVFKSLTQGIKNMIVQLIKAIAQAAIFATILSLIPGGSAVGKLFGGIGLKTGKGSIGGNLLGFLGLASGGLVTGPTMALVGEGSGTSLSNPEVVAPLDKLRSMLSNTTMNGNFVASTRLQGSDLLLVVERAERNRNR
jgi:hypothetical protein